MRSDRRVSVRFPVVDGALGAIAILTLEVIPDGNGTVYPDPDYHAVTVTDEDFDEAVRNAASATGFPCGDEDNPVDVRWRVKTDPTDATPLEINGGSAGGAFAVGLLLLKRGRGACRTEWLDSYVVMAGVNGDGRLTRVDAQDRKLEAVREAATGSGQDVRCLVVAESSEDIEIDGARVVSAAEVKDVLRLVNTLIIDGEPEPQFASEIISCHDSVINDGYGEDSLFFHPTGAVMERRDLSGSPPFLFPEVTGFAVQDLVFMFRITGKEEFLDKARMAADWLTTDATREDGAETHRGAWAEEGWCLTRDYIGRVPEDRSGEDWARSYAFESRNVFRFDNAIVALGLIDLYEQTHDRELLTKIRKLADNLCLAIGDDGEIDAVYNLDGRPVPQMPSEPGDEDYEEEALEDSLQENAAKWSRQKGPYLVRIAEALTRTARMELESTRPGHANTELAERCLSQARKLCAWVMAKQHRNGSDDGRFPTHGESTHLHPQLFAVEGLMECGMMFARHSSDGDESAAVSSEECLEAAVRGARWALRQVDQSRVPREVGPDGNPITWAQRTDVVAQLLYVGSRLYQAERFTDQEFEALADLAHAVLDMRHARRGYYRFGELSNGQSTETPSYWTEFYAVQGLLHYARAWLSRKTALVVLAGGIGTKSWPVACEAAPKSLTTSLIGESLMAATIRRCLETGCIQPSSIYVVCREANREMAESQAQLCGVPRENVVAEHEAPVKPRSQQEVVESECGTIQALQSCLERVAEDRDLLWISYSDGLFSPIEGFAVAAHRAAMSAYCDSEVVVSLGMWAKRRDPRYGHMAVDSARTLTVPEVHPVLRFAEKPDEDDYEALKGDTTSSRPEGNVAWESGNLISARDYWQSFLDEYEYAQGATISRDMLESSDVEVELAVAPYPSSVRWADLGLRPDLIGYFTRTLRERGESNVSLNPTPPVSLFKARGNLVISDRRAVCVVGVSDHLIVDCSESNVALVIPLAKLTGQHGDRLDAVRRCFENCRELEPFVKGGAAADGAAPFTDLIDSVGCVVVERGPGALVLAECEDLEVARTDDRLTVCWKPLAAVLTGLGPLERAHSGLKILQTRCEDDPLIVRHLLDVCFIANMVSRQMNVPIAPRPSATSRLSPRELSEVLTLVTLCHDLGGVLDRDKVELERRILDLFSKVSALNWPRPLPGAVLGEIILPLLKESGNQEITEELAHMDNAQVEEALANMDDDAQSALAAFDLDAIRHHDLRDAIIWTITNQESARCIQDLPNELGMPHVQLAHIFACLKIADSICFGETLWKPRVSEEPHDLAGCLDFIGDFLKPRLSGVANGELHMKYIDTVNRCLCGEDLEGDFGISLLEYIETQLRYKETDDREFKPVPLSCSDRIYLSLVGATLRGDQPDMEAVVEEEVGELKAEVGGAPWASRRDELVLLLKLPERMKHLHSEGARTVPDVDEVLTVAITRNLPLAAQQIAKGHHTGAVSAHAARRP